MAKSSIAKFAKKLLGEDEEILEPDQEEWTESYEGQLAIDVYQTDDKIVIKAPIAGVKPEDLEVTVSDDAVTIKGERKEEKKVEKENYLVQECYWGAFSRTYILPTPVITEKAQATLKDGILTITLPKAEKTKTKVLKIKTD